MKTKSQSLKSWLKRAFLIVIAGGMVAAAQAGTLQIQSNPVNFGSLYWGDPANWDTLGIPHYQVDTANDGSGTYDINYISVASDDYFFYVRVNFNEAPSFNGSDFYFWMDTDLNNNTGSHPGWGVQSIGSEYVISGAAIIQDPDAWNFVDWINWDQSPWTAGSLSRDVIFAINRQTQMPGVTAFDFGYQLHDSGAGTNPDWYPDSANTIGGDSFRYAAKLPADVGINFQENNNAPTGNPVTESAFGVPFPNWNNMTPGGTGTEVINLPGGPFGGPITVDWSAGNWNSTYTDGNTGDTEVYYGWLDFGWGANSSYVTVSGLSSTFTNGYVVLVAGSTDNGTGLQPVVLNGSETLTFSASRGSSGPIGGVSTASSVMTDDSVELQIPDGSVGSARAGLAGIIFVGTPVIQAQPQAPANALFEGDDLNLSASAIGPDLAFQWQKDGTNITEATNATYSVSNSSTNDSGSYDLIVSNSYGSVASSAVAVTINALVAPYNLVVSPASQTRYLGGSAYFSVAGSGAPPFTYQWNKGTSPINGATNATLSLFGLTADDATNYSCTVGNSIGSTTSGDAVLEVSSPLAYQSVVVADGPLAYYRLSEPTPPSSNVAYNSGSLGAAGNGVNFPGVVHQVPGALAGDSDTAMEYSAIDASSDDGGTPTIVPYNSALNPAGSFTVEAWLRPTENGVGNAQSPLFNRDANDTSANRVGWDFFQRDSSTGWNFRMFNGSAHDKVFDITGGAYTVGQWCHLVAVYDASAASATLYLNGVQVAQSTTPNGTFAPNTAFPLSIGGFSDGSQNPFVGDMDEVAIYASALSSSQVQAHYQNGINASRSTSYPALVTSGGAVEYLRLNEPAHDVTANSGSLGSAADGVYVHTINDAAGPAAPDFSGIESNNVSMQFNGNNSYVELGNPTGLNFSGQITLEAWVKPNPASTSTLEDVLAHGVNDTGDAEVMLRLTDVPFGAGYATYNVAAWDGSTAGASYTIPAEDLTGTNWVYLVGTYDGANWNLYRNGVLVNSQAGSFGALTIDNANWAIGARGRWKNASGYPDNGLNRQFEGGIDEVAIYNYALSAQQILSHYYMAVDGTTNVAPAIKMQPASQRATTNTTATFTIAAIGSPFPTYQWYLISGGTTNAIADATNSSYTTLPVQDSDSGNGYFVIVSNSAGAINSDIAFLTAGHMVIGAKGYLQNDEYFGNYPDSLTGLETLYPGAALPTPDKVEYLTSFEDNQDLPGSAGERIYGWFTPPVSGNYVFFEASDDASSLWLSTNSDPANVYQIAQNQAWMATRDWTCSNTGAGEYAYVGSGEWRSDQFELTGGNSGNAIANLLGGWSAWPTLNGDGSIPLVAGNKYYIELDHYQGSGGQNAAVTYKLASNADPASGDAPLLTGAVLSASVPDTILPEPQPEIMKISVSGSNVVITGSNGYVNAAYNVLSTTNLALPLSQWTVLSGARIDSNGNFSSTNAVGTASGSYYIIEVP